MASVLDWTYWHLGQAGTRRVLGGAGEIGALSLTFTPTSEAEYSRSFNGLRLVGD